MLVILMAKSKKTEPTFPFQVGDKITVLSGKYKDQQGTVHTPSTETCRVNIDGQITGNLRNAALLKMSKKV